MQSRQNRECLHESRDLVRVGPGLAGRVVVAVRETQYGREVRRAFDGSQLRG